MRILALSFVSMALLACSGGDGHVSFGSGGSTGGGGEGNFVPPPSPTVTVPAPDGCSPKTCEDLGANCETADNGCGGTIYCGQCADPDVCGLYEPNVCDILPCDGALEDPSKVPGLTGLAAGDYQALLDCVCHNGETTNQCSYDPASQSMCATNTVTWNFLTTDPIGACVAQYCSSVLWTCQHGNV